MYRTKFVLASICALFSNESIDSGVQVSTFFYEDENFIKVFETFVEDNAHKIDLSTPEMKLE